MKLDIAITANGIKTGLSVELCPETWPRLIEAGALSAEILGGEADLVESVLVHRLPEAVQRLVEVNYLFAANLLNQRIASMPSPSDESRLDKPRCPIFRESAAN